MANIYRFRQWSLTLLRITLGFIFAYHGYLKLFVPGGFNGTIVFFTSIGIPLPLYSALLVSIVEFVGGIFLIAGFLAKWTSMVIIIDMLAALFKVHLKNGFLIVHGGYEFVATLIVALVVILLNGPGILSLDRAVFGSEEETEEESDSETKKSQGRKSRKRAKIKDFEGNGIVSPTGITREEGYLYFVDKSGDVSRVRMARKGQRTSKKHELIAKLGIKRKEGYLYFVDKNGDVSQAKMARGQ
ncbi:MAG TPA: DoxX family protein [Candidatus Nanoarchaeia archaeon]|nr:DoxX family protein [Candidatus Nanoarchaeia archaeon]